MFAKTECEHKNHGKKISGSVEWTNDGRLLVGTDKVTLLIKNTAVTHKTLFMTYVNSSLF